MRCGIKSVYTYKHTHVAILITTSHIFVGPFHTNMDFTLSSLCLKYLSTHLSFYKISGHTHGTTYTPGEPTAIQFTSTICQ